MNVLIVGGDKIAYYLIGLLDLDRYSITLIDRRMDVCERIANQYPVSVFVGDGTDAAVLMRAGVESMDLVLALTGKDENNLIACQLAKTLFHVPQTISLVNNPSNEESIKSMGVDQVFSGTAILATIFEEEIEYPGLRTAYNIPTNNRAIVEFLLDEASPLCGQTLNDYRFPSHTSMVLVTRDNGEVHTPYGGLVMKAGDRCLLSCMTDQYEEIYRTFVKYIPKKTSNLLGLFGE